MEIKVELADCKTELVYQKIKQNSKSRMRHVSSASYLLNDWSFPSPAGSSENMPDLANKQQKNKHLHMFWEKESAQLSLWGLWKVLREQISLKWQNNHFNFHIISYLGK